MINHTPRVTHRGSGIAWPDRESGTPLENRVAYGGDRDGRAAVRDYAQ